MRETTFVQNQNLKELESKQILSYFHKNVRILEKNMIFVQGIPNALLNVGMLKKEEFFGLYGKVKKIAIRKMFNKSI